MWTVITQPGLVTTIIDFTTALSPLVVGLVSVVGLSAGMIVWAALQDRWAQKPQPRTETPPTSAEYQTAA
jgi:hypothetical protein